jgi:hypothetical protein
LFLASNSAYFFLETHELKSANTDKAITTFFIDDGFIGLFDL